MMGIWFASTLPADILSGYIGGLWSTMAKENFFLLLAGLAAHLWRVARPDCWDELPWSGAS